VLTSISIYLHLDLRTVGDMGELPSTLPIFLLPDIPLTLETLWIILPYSAAVAAVGLLESLMTASIVDELTDTSSDKNRECIGQGVANVVTGFFGGMGGCAMIGQSIININSGGRGRLSGITAALCLLSFIVFASDLIEMIPVAALVGVMFMVVVGTFAWSSLRILHKIPRSDALVLVLVSAVTVFTDLAIAVAVGVIVSALVFAWQNARRIYSETSVDEQEVKTYRLHGPLFFGSVRSFQDQFVPSEDPDEVVIDFRNSRVCDHSGIDAVSNLTERYLTLGKKLRLKYLSAECRLLLDNAGSMIEVNVIEDPRYKVAVDELA